MTSIERDENEESRSSGEDEELNLGHAELQVLIGHPFGNTQ